MLEIELNGGAHTLAAGTTLHDLVGSLGLYGQAVAVAVNRCVVARERWHETPLAAHDKVDVVRPITGG